jgi:(1->4)-alpha-D-glucan 1-alpha-D-glucosylmutase
MIDHALGELADFCGIEPGYHDIWGVWREAGAGTVRALLAAMGVRPDLPGGPQQALDELVRGQWSRVIPDAIVLRRSALAHGVALKLPLNAGTGSIDWRIVQEDGSTHGGSAAASELQVAEEREIGGTRRRAVRLPLPVLPTGYHRIEILCEGGGLAQASLVVAPERCFLPEGALRGARFWGVALQLYGLRSGRNWGIGDFGDLAEAGTQWAACGAAYVGVNPLHALYLAIPDHASPYSPSSRLFLNPLYLDVEAIEEYAGCAAARELVASPSFAATTTELRSSGMVDYDRVAAVKMPVLEQLYEHFRQNDGERHAGRGRGFENFCRERGEPLRRFALYETLHEHFRRQDINVGSWQQWPEPYRNPESAEVVQFAQEHEERIGFFCYLQWQAASQLAAAHAACRHGGIGLYLDLAVSVDRGGADAWARQDLYALRASIGAPPDDFNPAGQDWGLPPCNPEAMKQTGYAMFIETLRANMASAGALRIDHVMGLARLFWIAGQGGAAEGAYVRYPLEDLLAIIALESERHACMVIGEDLGTVPVQLRHALREWGVLSYRLLMFERDASGRFSSRPDFPVHSMVAFSTHDLPTFAGYWKAQDGAMRRALVEVLRKSKVLPAGVDARADLAPDALARLCHAVHLYLARSAALMLAVQLDDVAGAAEQANVPGTPDAAPNWRRKLPLSLEELRCDARLRQLCGELGEARRGARACR